MPDEFVRYGHTWEANHPGWEMKLWTDENLPDLGPWRRTYEQARNPAEKSDLLRYFILYRHGGVYIDTDFECFKSIEPLLIGETFVTSQEYPEMASPGFFGCVRHSPILRRLLRDAKNRPIDPTKSMLDTFGPRFFTKHCIGNSNVTILPTAFFYPYLWHEQYRKGETFPHAFAAHHWAHSWKLDDPAYEVARIRRMKMIPHVFHRIWIGGAPMPDEFVRYGHTWEANHPGWEMKLWTDENLPDLGPWLKTFNQARNAAEKASLLRYIILHRFGGVYIDTDFECFKNIEPLLTQPFVTALERPGVAANGFFACSPNSAILQEMLDDIRDGIDTSQSQSDTLGPRFFSRHCLGRRDASYVPSDYFYPYGWHEQHRKGESFPRAYAAHHWAHSWRADDPTQRNVLPAKPVVPPLLLSHAKPKIACIAVYFNPCGYEALLQNYHRFRDQPSMRKVPLTTIELSFDGEFHIPDATIRLTGSSDNILWQKERLINIAEERLDSSYDAIAYIDADLLFLNPDWYDEASESLLEAPAIQLFSHINYLDPAGEIFDRRESVVKPYAENGTYGWNPGGAWAVDRRLFPLIDFDPVGANDALQSASWMPIATDYLASILPWRQYQSFNAVRERTLPIIAGRVTYVQGDIVHLFHGSRINRRFAERSEMLRQHDFDPAKDLALDSNGLWRWTGTKPGLQSAVRDYFFGRREDDRDAEPQLNILKTTTVADAVEKSKLADEIQRLDGLVQARDAALHHMQLTRSWRYTTWMRRYGKWISR